MIIFFIPVYLIVALIIILIGGIWQIASQIYMILIVAITIICGIAGVYAFIIALSETITTGRIYLLIPGLLSVPCGVGCVNIFRQCFCLSEKWSSPSGWGTLMIHDNDVFRWAILATLIISVLFVLFFYLSCTNHSVLISIFFSLLASLILIVPLFVTHSYCEKQYYKNHSTTYEQVYVVKEDVEVRLYVNESYRGGSLNVTGEYDIIREIFPKKLKKGEIVYGEKMDPNFKNRDVEVFNDNNVIGDVPQEYLEPQ